MNTKWTNTEIQYLRDNYAKIKSKDIANILNRTVSSIHSKANSLKIKHPNPKGKIVFSESEFLEAIKVSNTHTKAMRRLGYAIKTFEKCSPYWIMFRKLNPNIEHFNHKSHVQLNKDIPIEEKIDLLLKGNFTITKYAAIKRNFDFDIDFEFFKNICKKKCFYCGNHGDTRVVRYNLYVCGIDRLNNKLGYNEENCVPCCKKCNMMKKVMSKEDFINQCKLIAIQHAN